MPYCRNCHNRRLFGVSNVPPAAPTANGPPTGLMGDFADDGGIISITRLGADKHIAGAATANPSKYFDVCLKCGSTDIDWSIG